MRPRLSAINILSVSILGAGVLIFVYLIIVRPSMSDKVGAEAIATPSTQAPLPEDTEEPIPTMQPGQEQLVFVSNRDGNAEIYTITLDGSAPVRLTYTDADEQTPKWSPDGRFILFIAERDTSSFGAELYVMNSDGSNQTMIATGVGPVVQAEWSPDASQIAFTMADAEGYPHLYLISPSGIELREIWARVSDDFSWSPDGQSIVLAGVDVASGVTESTIYVVETTSGAFRVVSEPGSYGFNARWSPDGHTISFTKGAVPSPGGNDIYFADALGGEPPRRVTNGGLNIETMEWSPDGQYLAFSAWDPTSQSATLYRVAAGGGEPEDLAASTLLTSMSWSPDSKMFAVDTGSAADNSAHIIIVDSNGHYVENLDTFGDAQMPDWSPGPVSLPPPILESTPIPSPTPLPTPVEPAPTEEPALSIVELTVWPDPDEVVYVTPPVLFGQRIEFHSNQDVSVLMIAFLLHADETVPAQTDCMTRNGSMPDAHPGRLFWSAGYPNEYPAGGPHLYEEEYGYKAPEPGITHVISWLVMRDTSDQVIYCNQAVYAIIAP